MGHKPEDEEDDDSLISIPLSLMTWAEVCAALKHYIGTGTEKAPASKRSALYALREIDRIVMGHDEQAPPDEVLKPLE